MGWGFVGSFLSNPFKATGKILSDPLGAVNKTLQSPGVSTLAEVAASVLIPGVGGELAAAAIGAYSGGVANGGGLKGAVIGGIEGGVTGMSAQALTGAVSAGRAAAGVGLAPGAAGPVTSGLGGEAQVMGNAAIDGAEASPLGTAVSSASRILGSPNVSKATTALSATASAVGAYSALTASKGKGSPAIPSAVNPANDPASIAMADQAAQDALNRRRGSAANILTGPTGIGRAGQSASQTLLG